MEGGLVDLSKYRYETAKSDLKADYQDFYIVTG